MGGERQLKNNLEVFESGIKMEIWLMFIVKCL